MIVPALACLTWSWVAADDQRAFGGEERYLLAAPVVGIAVSDLNQDSWPDIVSVESDGQRSWVSSWHNDRLGHLVLARRDSFQLAFASVAAADFNGDGALDLALPVPGDPSGASIALVRAGPSGSFELSGSYPAGANASVIQVGDLDSDGVPDLVVAGDDLLTSYMGNGDGTFGKRSDTAMPSAPWWPPRALHLADLDHDSHLDAIYSPGGAPVVRIFRGVGGGSFLPAHEIAMPYRGLAIPVDGDSDGWIDLCVEVAPFGPGTLLMLWNDGTGAIDFTRRDSLAGTDGDHEWMSLVAADCDGDGRADLFYRSRVGHSHTWIGNLRGAGARQFEPAPTILLNNRISTWDNIRLLSATDLDRDGYADLISYRPSGWFPDEGKPHLGVLRHATPDAFRGFHRYDAPSDSVAALQGRLFTVRLQGHTLELIDPRPGGGFQYWWFDHQQRLAGPIAVWSEGVLEGVADFNGDGRTEVLISRGTDLDLLTASSGLTFTRATTWTDARLLGTDDFDGDHALDVAVRSGQDSVTLLLNDEAGGFSALHTNLALGPGWDASAAGDLSGDGRADLVFQVRAQDRWLDDSVCVAPYEGAGAFGPARMLPYTSPRLSPALTRGLQVVIHDLDGDRDGDVALLNQRPLDGWVEVFENEGEGYLSHRASLPTSESPASLTAHDFDGDGHGDLAVANTPDGYAAELRVFYGGFEGSWPYTYRHVDYGGAMALAAGDINGDEKIDLVMSMRYNDLRSMAVIFNTTPDVTTSALVSLIQARAEGRSVFLRWWTSEEVALATVEREAGGGWSPIGVATSAGNGVRAYVDHAVRPGSRYRYRLRLDLGDGPAYSEIAEVRIPGELLAIESIAPNPTRGGFAIRLVNSTATNLRVDLYDLAGRRVLRQDVAAGPADQSSFLLSPAERLPAGLYLLKVVEGKRQATARIAIIR